MKLFSLVLLLLLPFQAGAQVGYPIPQHTKTQWEQERDSVIAYRAVMAGAREPIFPTGQFTLCVDDLSPVTIEARRMAVMAGAQGRTKIDSTYAGSPARQVYVLPLLDYWMTSLWTENQRLSARIDSLEAKLARAQRVVKSQPKVARDTLNLGGMKNYGIDPQKLSAIWGDDRQTHFVVEGHNGYLEVPFAKIWSKLPVSCKERLKVSFEPEGKK